MNNNKSMKSTKKKNIYIYNKNNRVITAVYFEPILLASLVLSSRDRRAVSASCGLSLGDFCRALTSKVRSLTWRLLPCAYQQGKSLTWRLLPCAYQQGKGLTWRLLPCAYQQGKVSLGDFCRALTSKVRSHLATSAVRLPAR